MKAASRWWRATVGPGGTPRYPGDLRSEVLKDYRRTFWQSLPTFLVMIAAGAIAFASTSSVIGRVIGVCLIAGAPVAMLVVRWRLLSRRTRPAGHVLLWLLAEVNRSWQTLDGGDYPATEADAFTRLDAHDGALSTRLRIGMLLSTRRFAEAETALEAWHPASPSDIARRELLLSDLAFARGTDDLSSAAAAARAIADPDDRRRYEVIIQLERARRLAIQHRDAIPSLVAARRILDAADLAGVPEAIRPLSPRRLGIAFALTAGTIAIFVLWLTRSSQPGLQFPADLQSPVDGNGFSFQGDVLVGAGRAAPFLLLGPELDAKYARSEQLIEQALPLAIDLGTIGGLGANTSRCPTVCIEWSPHGRQTRLPPNPRGPRIWRVNVNLGRAIAGTGPGIAEVWFTGSDPGAIASMQAAASGDTTPSYQYQLDPATTNALIDLFFPKV